MACLTSSDCLETAFAEQSPETFFTLGMQCSIGGEVPTDLVSAHKWFNLAAMRGDQDAIRLRREIAGLMSNAEIGAAQRAARDYIKQHPHAFPSAQRMSAAALRIAQFSIRIPATCLAKAMVVGHIGRDGDVAEWLKAAVC